MSLKGTIRDSWDVWRAKVNAAIGTVERIDADEVKYDSTASGLQATDVQTAIDEVDAKVNDLDGEDVSYDNTTSELEATNVQSAIDEVDAKVDNLDGEDVAYDNTTSGFEATNIQSAIDEAAAILTNIPNGYAYLERRTETITVEDSTFNECLEAIANKVLDIVDNIGDDEIIQPFLLIIDGNITMRIRGVNLTNASTSILLVLDAVTADASTFGIFWGLASTVAAQNQLYWMSFASSAWSHIDLGARAASASQSLTFTYDVFKAIKANE